MHLVSLAFLLPCSSVLVIVSAERKKQRSISNPTKNNWPDSQSHLLSAGILLMLSQLQIVQFPPDQPSKARAPGDWYCHLAEWSQREPCVHHGWNTPVVMTTQRMTDRCMSWWNLTASRFFYKLNIFSFKCSHLKYFNKCLRRTYAGHFLFISIFFHLVNLCLTTVNIKLCY